MNDPNHNKAISDVATGHEDIPRRRFIQQSAAAAAGVVAVVGLVGCSQEQAAKPAPKPTAKPAPKPAPKPTFRTTTPPPVKPAPLVAQKTYPTGYYKYHRAPASIVDYGMLDSEEERAADLHRRLHIFDGEPEVGYYEGLYENMLLGGAAGVGGSFTVGAFPFDKMHGFAKPEEIEIRPSDWWTMETLDSGLEWMRKQARTHSDKVMLCYNNSDIRNAYAQGKIAIMLDVQSTYFFDRDHSLLEHYYNQGLRRVQLTHNRTLLSGTGCMEKRDGGLTIFGKEVVEHLNQLNMLVDVGHCSPLTMMDAIDASSKPITCSNAGMRSIALKNPRTHPDEALKKLAENGGVFGVVGMPGTLANAQECTTKDFVESIDKAVTLMGIDHVGFALDQMSSPSLEEFLTSPDWPASAVKELGVGHWPWSDGHKGMENQSGYPNLTRGLVDKGYKDEEIMKLMGGNFIRLITETIG